MNQELGKYKILDKLGEGATAEVYHAIDTGLDRQVALKVLKPALVPDPSAFARFVQEAKAAARLFHNHIATVLDMGDAEGRYFIAMRYIEGESLDKILKEEGPLSWDETLRMAGQIGEALDYAHGEGFLHRDVKPNNILRDEKGDFWLTDFGLTRAMMSTGLTSHTGAVLGTPSYIAPEIWQGEDAVPATDQYALACVVYEAVTGDVLFEGDTPPAVMTGHVLNGPDLPGGWPESLNDCIAPLRKALSKDPTDRYDSISIYANKLGRKKTPEQKRARLEAEHKAQLEAEEKVSREREIAAQEDEERSEGSDQPIAEGPLLKAESRKLKTPWWQDWRVWAGVAGVLVAFMVFMGTRGQQPMPTEEPIRTEKTTRGESATGGGDVEEIATQAPSTEKPGNEEAVTDEPSGSDDNCNNPEVLCVGLVTDVGEVDDKSFNQSAWEGVQMAADELGAEIDYIETKDFKDYSENIDLFAEEGYDVIVTVGFALGEATIEAAKTYPEINFIGVDQFQADPVDNLAGLIFEEDKSGYMAGALAGLLTETNTVAAVLGTDIVPPVVAFKEGYESGAKYVNPNVNVLSTYHPGGLDVAFTDPEWGATTAKQAIDNGADIVFGAGGNTGNGALIETAGYESVYCIGVDTDQWFTVPEAQPCLVSSAMKLITPGVYDLIKLAHEDNFPSGNYVGEFGLAPFHDFEDEISQNIKDQLDDIQTMLLNDELDTGYPSE